MKIGTTTQCRHINHIGLIEIEFVKVGTITQCRHITHTGPRNIEGVEIDTGPQRRHIDQITATIEFEGVKAGARTQHGHVCQLFTAI